MSNHLELTHEELNKRITFGASYQDLRDAIDTWKDYDLSVLIDITTDDPGVGLIQASMLCGSDDDGPLPNGFAGMMTDLIRGLIKAGHDDFTAVEVNYGEEAERFHLEIYFSLYQNLK